MTSAYRTALWLRKQGFTAHVVEHTYGGLRHDLAGVGDVLAWAPKQILLIQAYQDDQRARDKHRHLDANHPVIKSWTEAGGRFVHVRLRKRMKKRRPHWEFRLIHLDEVVKDT